MTRPASKEERSLLEAVGSLLAEMESESAELETQIEWCRNMQKEIRKQQGILQRRTDAMIRRTFLAGSAPFAGGAALLAERFQLYSQNEEDGILLGLLRRTGTPTRRFVEIGAGRGGGNSAILAMELGWEGLMIEPSPVAAAALARRFAQNAGVRVLAEFATPENVNELLAGNGVAGAVDVLSLDIDSYDFWVFRALTACEARVLVLEYNAAFGPEARVTVPLGALAKGGTPKTYRGASLSALAAEAAAKGYRLVACDPMGSNAFFVRNGLASELSEAAPAIAFRPAVSRTRSGDEPKFENAAAVLEGFHRQGLRLDEV